MIFPFDILEYLVDYVTHLVRIVARKNQTLVAVRGNLSSAQRKLESMHLENASLTQQLVDCIGASLGVVSQSFENAL